MSSENLREELENLPIETVAYENKGYSRHLSNKGINQILSCLSSQIKKMENPYLEDTAMSVGWNACQNAVIGKLQ